MVSDYFSSLIKGVGSGWRIENMRKVIIKYGKSREAKGILWEKV